MSVSMRNTSKIRNVSRKKATPLKKKSCRSRKTFQEKQGVIQSVGTNFQGTNKLEYHLKFLIGQDKSYAHISRSKVTTVIRRRRFSLIGSFKSNRTVPFIE